jgi:6-phosphofructo-2-kinase/fructose-2,6-biphosphatase 2
MVGLPARGKTFISQKVCRYLQWLGIETQVFNVGNYRRKIAGAHQTHEFFDPNNTTANEVRMQAAMEALEDLLKWLSGPKRDQSRRPSTFCGESNSRVAIYDATNSTVERRLIIRDRCAQAGVSVMFIESICTTSDLIMANIREVKLSSPDYLNCEPEKAAADFMARIKHYEDAYETLGKDASENDASYVQLIDVGTQSIINMIQGYLQTRVVFYLMNLHITPRSILMCRVGI